MGKRRRVRHVATWPADVLTCRHTWDDAGTERPTLGTVGDGVVCTLCGMLLTWDELAEYMRGDTGGSDGQA